MNMNPKSSGNSVNESDSSSPELKKKKKHKRKEKKHKQKKRKHKASDSEPESNKHSKNKKRKRSKEKKIDKKMKLSANNEDDIPGPSVPEELIIEQAKSQAPLTKDEWEKSQSIIRRVYDETTGRTRLIKGDGEILEEIVSKERHREINKQATFGDGVFFQNQLTDRN